MHASRTLAVRRYRIDGRLPALTSSEFFARLAERRFRPLLTGQARTFGWVDAENLLCTELDEESVVRAGWALVGIRIDKRRLNPRLLRAQMDLEVRARRAAAGDAGQARRVSRDERSRLRADLQAEMLRDTTPSVEAHTVAIRPATRDLWAMFLGAGANEILRGLFRDTFGARIETLTPWRRGEELVRGPDLGALSRTDFGDDAVSVDPVGSADDVRRAEVQL